MNNVCAVVHCGRTTAGYVQVKSLLGAFINVPLCIKHLAEEKE